VKKSLTNCNLRVLLLLLLLLLFSSKHTLKIKLSIVVRVSPLDPDTKLERYTGMQTLQYEAARSASGRWRRDDWQSVSKSQCVEKLLVEYTTALAHIADNSVVVHSRSTVDALRGVLSTGRLACCQLEHRQLLIYEP
jgi:uncharacterized membrane-anchored protein